MKIAFCSQEYPPETAHGGIATQTRAKARGLAALGHDVYVISHSVTPFRTEGRDGPVQVIRIPGFDGTMPLHTESARWLTYSSLVAAEVSALNERVGFDVVDFPEWGGEAFVHLLNRTPWNHVPTVVHIQGPLVMLANTIGWPEKDSDLYRIGSMMEATCLRLADQVISSSTCSADWCRRHYGIDRDIPVLHAGIDTTRFAPRATGTPAPPAQILFAGRVAASKGVDTLVAAACRLAPEFPGLRLRLVGRVDTAFRATLEERARAAGRDAMLEFAGFVPAEGLPAELSRATVFAAPSRYEGGPGFVCLEAMAAGLPVVSTSGSGVAEIIAHGRTGLLVTPGDERELAAALRGLLLDAPLRERLGAAARRYVEAEADTQVCVRKLEQVYARVARSRA